jgi:hypothetical protein
MRTTAQRRRFPGICAVTWGALKIAKVRMTAHPNFAVSGMRNLISKVPFPNIRATTAVDPRVLQTLFLSKGELMKKSHSEDWQKPVGPEYAVDEPEFMAEFGRAMAAWGNIEHALSGVYALVLEAKQPHYARASFHSVISFRDRLGMVDVAVRLATTCFPGSLWENLEAEWARLRDTASKASKRRNTLAHMHVWLSPKFGTFGWKDITRISELPIDYEGRRAKAVTIDKMRDYRKSFDNCARRIIEFENELSVAMDDPMRDVGAS